MIFTLNSAASNSYIILIFYAYAVSLTYTNLFGSYNQDLLTRIDENSLGLTSLFWMWTNTYYLYTIMVFTLLYTIFLYVGPRIPTILLILKCYVAVLYMEIYSNLNSTMAVLPQTAHLDFYNLLLNNGINKVHPFLIYLCWLSLVLFGNKFYSKASSYYSNTLHTSVLIAVAFLGLILGGWWAYQEGSWGGWWNWDPSEMFGLLILLSIALKLHTKTIFSTKLSLLVLVSILPLLMYYLFLQLNFSLLSHNFGIRQGDVVDFRYAYIIVLLVAALAIAYNSTLSYILSCTKYASKVTAYKLILYVVAILVIYITTCELWSDLLWRLLNIDINNSSKLLVWGNLSLLIVTCLTYLATSPPLLIVVASAVVFTTPLCALVAYLSVRSFAYRNLHMVALVLVLIIVLHSTYTITLSTLINDNLIKNLAVNLPLTHNCTYDKCFHLYSVYGSSLTSNSVDTKSFQLISNSCYTAQGYEVSYSDVNIIATVKDYYNLSVLLALLVPVLLSYSPLRNIYIIKF
jgi:cytochrome c biogenesis factor